MFKESNEINAFEKFKSAIHDKFQEKRDAAKATEHASRLQNDTGKEYRRMNAIEKEISQRIEEEVAEMAAEAFTSMNCDAVLQAVYDETDPLFHRRMAEKILKHAAEKLLTQHRPE